MKLRRDAEFIINKSIQAVLPDEAVKKALSSFSCEGGKIVLVAVGKAAWQMAAAAVEVIGHIDRGIVITKYGHLKGELAEIECYEAGHPVPDENSFAATKRALDMVSDLSEKDSTI